MVSGPARMSYFLLLPSAADMNGNMRNKYTSAGEWPEGGDVSPRGKCKTK
jgi:hypothetical protein